MSDFHTKKQKKYWCKDCKIFIEYTNMSIEQHKKSKNHLRMTTSDQVYKNQKAKIMRHVNYLNNGQEERGTNLSNNSQQDTNNITSSTNLANKRNRSNNIVSSNSGFIDEIKKEMMQEMMIKKGKKPKNTATRVWGEYWDDNSNMSYYYNFITQKSQWEKPDDYDGPELEDETDNINTDSKIKCADPKAGIIGKWETVTPNKSIFNSKTNEEKVGDSLPGVISRKEYMLNAGLDLLAEEDEQIIGLEDIDDDENEEEDIEQDNDLLDNDQGGELKKRNIDKYIYEGEDKSNNQVDVDDNTINLNNEDIININQKLKDYGNEITFVNPKHHEDTLKINDALPEDREEKIAFSFKTTTKNMKKFTSFES